MSEKIQGRLYCPICGKVAAHLLFNREAVQLDAVERATKDFNAHIEGHGNVVLVAYASALKKIGAALLAFGASRQFLSITRKEA
jgi:uncharacterized Zn finger protein (UPF0148 family)